MLKAMVAAFRPSPFDLEREVDRTAEGGRAIPSPCLRVLYSLFPLDQGGGCQHDCPGVQPGGGCLCDIVRAADAQGVEWRFELDRDGSWAYAGPPLS